VKEFTADPGSCNFSIRMVPNAARFEGSDHTSLYADDIILGLLIMILNFWKHKKVKGLGPISQRALTHSMDGSVSTLVN